MNYSEFQNMLSSVAKNVYLSNRLKITHYTQKYVSFQLFYSFLIVLLFGHRTALQLGLHNYGSLLLSKQRDMHFLGAYVAKYG